MDNNSRKAFLAFIAGMSLLSSTCIALGADMSPKGTNERIDQIEKKVEDTKNAVEELKKRKTQEFAGLHFGVGIGFTQTFGRDRIESVFNDNGIVRIEGETNAIPRVLLESHIYLTPKQWGEVFSTLDYTENPTGKIGIGPFIALQPGSDSVIQAIVAGIMIGLKDPMYKDANHTWNLGIGISVEPSSKTLGDGLKANEPIPAGAALRTQDRSLVGITALISYGW